MFIGSSVQIGRFFSAFLSFISLSTGYFGVMKTAVDIIHYFVAFSRLNNELIKGEIRRFFILKSSNRSWKVLLHLSFP